MSWSDAVTQYARALKQGQKYHNACVIRGQNLALPDEASATDADWDAWAEKYLLHPTGKIAQIRVSLMQ